MFRKSLIILLISFLIYPSMAKAENYTSYNRKINSVEKFDIGDLSIEDLCFNDYSSTLSYSFGLYGKIENTSLKTYSVNATVEYYTLDDELVVEATNILTVSPYSSSNINLMHNVEEIISDKKASEIDYYNLKIITSEVEVDKSLYSKPSLDPQYKSFPYLIDEYNIVINVNENNTFDIEEKVTVYFNKQVNNFFKKIPLGNTIYNSNGKSIKNRAQVSNIQTKDSIKETNEKGYKVLQIGGDNLSGSHTYSIKYTYNVGIDPFDEEDMFYFNIIGSEWDIPIGNIKFKINMPLDFDHSKISFSNGFGHIEENSKIKYTVSGKVIEGEYDGVLSKNKALTVQIGLDDGYFVGAGFPSPSYLSVMYIVPIVCMMLSVLLWYIYGKDDEIVETVEFYPPKGLNSLDVGYIYKGKCTDEDVFSLLLYLACKGYIRIEEVKEKSFLHEKGFRIYKLKEYDGKNEIEALFLESLFKNKTIINRQTFVRDEDLKGLFDEILDDIKDKKDRQKSEFFVDGEHLRKSIVGILMVITLFVNFLIPFINYDMSYNIFTVMAIVLLIMPFCIILFNRRFKVYEKIFIGGIILFQTILVLKHFFPIVDILLSDEAYIRAYVTSILSVFVMGICFKAMPKRTMYGNQVLGKLMGLKKFMETAGKEELKKLVKNNPSYCYDLLPFAYVLGIMSMWIKKFEGISFMEPDWYTSVDKFNIRNFNDSIDSTMDCARRVLSKGESFLPSEIDS